MRVENIKGPDQENQYIDLEFKHKGGMGEIYLAKDVFNNKTVAIKIIPIENSDEKKLFESEMSIAIKLKHPNIIPTYYKSTFNHDGIDYLYCVMDYYTEGNFRKVIANNKSSGELIPIDTCLKYFIDMCKALEYAHKSIIHRDLKPENMLLSNGEILLCDFGLAKIVNTKTRSNSFKGAGTYPYMAPECWTFDSNSFEMDIYSLGIIFFEVLTLNRPFNGANYDEFKEKHLYDQLPEMSNYRHDVPVALNELILAMTSKRKTDRKIYATEIKNKLVELTIKDNSADNDNMDRLLKLAQSRISEKEKVELDISREEKNTDEKRKQLNFSIKELYSQINNEVSKLNKKLQREKINLYETNNNYTLSFMESELHLSMYNEYSILQYLDDRKKAFHKQVTNEIGMRMQRYRDPYLFSDNVVLIGKIVVNSSRYRNYGYNLLLRNDNDNYGKWWAVSFSDNSYFPKGQLNATYPIDLPHFFEEYEFGRTRTRAMHTRIMDMRYFDKNIIEDLLEKVLS